MKMESVCTDGWHIQPASSIKVFGLRGTHADPLPDPADDGLVFPSELEALPVIEPPTWLYIGSTGYPQQERYVSPKDYKEGQFKDPYGRRLFLLNELVVFQRYPGNPMLLCDFINTKSFTSPYGSIYKDAETNKALWDYEPYGTPEHVQLPSSFQIVDGCLTYDLTGLHDYFVGDVDGHRVIGARGRVRYQRWTDKYVMMYACV